MRLGRGSVRKLPTVQAWGTEFNPQHPWKKTDVAACTNNFSVGVGENKKASGILVKSGRFKAQWKTWQIINKYSCDWRRHPPSTLSTLSMAYKCVHTHTHKVQGMVAYICNLTLGRARQEDCDLEASLGYIKKTCWLKGKAESPKPPPTYRIKSFIFKLSSSWAPRGCKPRTHDLFHNNSRLNR